MAGTLTPDSLESAATWEMGMAWCQAAARTATASGSQASATASSASAAACSLALALASRTAAAAASCKDLPEVQAGILTDGASRFALAVGPSQKDCCARTSPQQSILLSLLPLFLVTPILARFCSSNSRNRCMCQYSRKQGSLRSIESLPHLLG